MIVNPSNELGFRTDIIQESYILSPTLRTPCNQLESNASIIDRVSSLNTIGTMSHRLGNNSSMQHLWRPPTCVTLANRQAFHIMLWGRYNILFK